MQTIHIQDAADLNFSQARGLAMQLARESLVCDPVVIAWHNRQDDAMSPSFAGADPASWWEKFGEGNGGRLEIQVGGRYEFIVADAAGYETLDGIPLRNLRGGDGTEYLCYASHERPQEGDACTPLDEWMAKQN